MNELSLYIHIPFCIKKCAYCDFLSFPSSETVKEQYVENLCKELIESAKETDNKVSTIFFGGGTPTSLRGEQLQTILECILTNYNVDETAEITIEMNPGTIAPELMSFIQCSRVNRVSIGLQSTHSKHLINLSRIHTYEEFLDTYRGLRDAGISNINIDLMFGLPNQSLKEWKSTLETIIDLKPEHISAYGLIIEEGTPFYNLYEQGELELPDEELEREMYYFTNKFLKENRIFHYEISNYARQGYECRHNLAYWTDKEYQGIGLGASSYVQGLRYKNTEDMDLYNQNSDKFQVIRIMEEEQTKNRRLEEALFLGLRLIKGVHIPTINKLYNNPFENIYKNVIKEYITNECLVIEGDYLKLTKKGIDISNQVFADFLIDED